MSLFLLHARMPTELSRATSKSKVNSSEGCSKCGIVKQSGKLSCCARGGAWFKKCGDFGDSNFDHTWVDGIQACKSKSPSVSCLLWLLWCVSCHRNGLVAYPRRYNNTYGIPSTVMTSAANPSRPAYSDSTATTFDSTATMTSITTAGMLT